MLVSCKQESFQVNLPSRLALLTENFIHLINVGSRYKDIKVGDGLYTKIVCQTNSDKVLFFIQRQGTHYWQMMLLSVQSTRFQGGA